VESQIQGEGLFVEFVKKAKLFAHRGRPIVRYRGKVGGNAKVWQEIRCQNSCGVLEQRRFITEKKTGNLKRWERRTMIKHTTGGDELRETANRKRPRRR